MNSTTPETVLVSACLAGLRTRYDGELKTNQSCLAQLQKALWVPACPEQLGGLPTPREAANIVGGDGYDVLEGRARVITRSGGDVTDAFVNGAHQVLLICRQQNITCAFLKARSPSCGVNGTIGVTAALLASHGIQTLEF